MTTGVVLMTYGSPRDYLNREDVAEYMTRVRGGRRPDDELLDEFARRYAVIGGSPLVPITQSLARATERALAETGDTTFRVEAGMRFSNPSVDDAVRALAEGGAERVLGVIISPQYSPILMSGYGQALAEAGAKAGVGTRMVGAWHLEPLFVQVLADRVREGLAGFPEDVRDAVPVLMTAHSLPERVVDREPGYVVQLKDTAEAVARVACLTRDRWTFAYQSAGHTPEEWLKPDMLDVLPELAKAGHKQALLAPVQFLGDHLETLYDIDVAGREQAVEAGMTDFRRVPAPNDAPDLAAAIAEVVRKEVEAWEPTGEGAAWATA